MHYVEYLIIRDNEFENVHGSVVSIYRGGRDESTFGPHAFISDSTFVSVGAGAAPLAGRRSPPGRRAGPLVARRGVPDRAAFARGVEDRRAASSLLRER